jgi:hypothetical protein
MTRGKNLIGLEGQRFGRLTVLYLDDQRLSGGAVWVCRCDCGQEYKARAKGLKNGTSSCGCLRSMVTSARETRHGESVHNSSSPVVLEVLFLRIFASAYHAAPRSILGGMPWSGLP